MFFGAGFLAARACSSAIASSYFPWRRRSSAEANSEGGAGVEDGASAFGSGTSCPAQVIATRRNASRGLGTDTKDSPEEYATIRTQKRGSLNQTPSKKPFLVQL